MNAATKPYAFEEAVTARHRLLLSKVTVHRTRSKTAKRDQGNRRNSLVTRDLRKAADYLPLLFIGEAFCSVASNSLAQLGTGTAFWKTMDFALTSLPYRFLLAPLSGRRVEPAREMPAKSPRARE